MSSIAETDDLVALIQRLRAGDATARERLVDSIYSRLLNLSRSMLRSGSAKVQRWEQTEDLAHAAWFRIQRMLEDSSIEVADARQFFRLAARHIRFEIIGMYRKHTGAQGTGANHHTAICGDASQQQGDNLFAAHSTADPQRLLAWAEFHEAVEKLPDREKEVVDLLWYQGLKQQEAAELLGVDVKTVKRRWRDIKLKLCESLDHSLISF